MGNVWMHQNLSQITTDNCPWKNKLNSQVERQRRRGASKPKSYGTICQYFSVMVVTYVKAKGTLLVLYLQQKSTSPLLRRTKSVSKETSNHELALLRKCSFNGGHSTTGSESVHLSEVIPNRHDGCGRRKRLGILNWMGRRIPLLGSTILCAQDRK